MIQYSSHCDCSCTTSRSHKNVKSTISPTRIRQIDRIIARIQVAVKRGRIIQLTTQRVLLGPAPYRRVVVAGSVLVQPRAAVKVPTGKAPRVGHRPGGTGQVAIGIVRVGREQGPFTRPLSRATGKVEMRQRASKQEPSLLHRSLLILLRVLLSAGDLILRFDAEEQFHPSVLAAGSSVYFL